MPRLDGLGVLDELRARMRTATLPVIMLTASIDDTEEKALDLGAHDFLTKPVQSAAGEVAWRPLARLLPHCWRTSCPLMDDPWPRS